MMLKFREWLFVENTVSQLLKTDPTAAELQQMVRTVVKKYGWTQNVSDPQLEPLIKLISFWLLPMHQKAKQMNMDLTNRENIWNAQVVDIYTRKYFNGTSDYLAYLLKEQPNIARSKFNNPQYTFQNLEADTDKWHDQLAQKKRQGADPGRVVEIANMPQGWTWVSLDKDYCDKEGNAMGHCGNQGRKEGDNIWSLRNNKNIPYLTFIVNEKILGESKGVANNKPEVKFHPHIIAFLLGHDNGNSIVEYVKGGGYKPENNFHLQDLDKGTLETLLKQKPQLDDYFLYLKEQAGGNEQKWKELIDDAFNYIFKRVDVANQLVVVEEFQDMTHLIDWLKNNTQSKLDEIPDLEDGFFHMDFNVSKYDAIHYFNHDANKINEELMKKIIALMSKEDEDEETDVEWAYENNDEVTNALDWSANDALRVGAESEAYDSVSKFFKDEEDKDGNGFIIKPTYGGGYNIIITLKDLEKVYKDNDDWNYNGLTDYMTYRYSAPYNGFSGFDQHAYNERLQEILHDVLNSLQKQKVTQ